MKRPPHSFVVEVRKQRRPPGEPAKSWFEEPPPTAPTPASLAAFAEPAPAEAAPSRPAGRILQILVEPPPASDDGAAPAVKPRKAKAAAAEKKLPAYKKLPGYKKRLAKLLEAPPAPPPVQAQVASPSQHPTSAAETRQPSRAERHARILKRYVYGGEPKAGERWKRRLQRSDR